MPWPNTEDQGIYTAHDNQICKHLAIYTTDDNKIWG